MKPEVKPQPAMKLVEPELAKLTVRVQHRREHGAEDGYTPFALVEVSTDFRGAVAQVVKGLPWKASEDFDMSALLSEFAVVWWLRDDGRAVAGPLLFHGHPAQAPVDIVVWRRDQWDGIRRVNVGVKSTTPTLLNRWGNMPYNADRIDSEFENLAHYVVATSVDGAGRVAIWGAIRRRDLIRVTAKLRRTSKAGDIRSEHEFYGVPLREFTFTALDALREGCEPVPTWA